MQSPRGNARRFLAKPTIVHPENELRLVGHGVTCLRDEWAGRHWLGRRVVLKYFRLGPLADIKVARAIKGNSGRGGQARYGGDELLLRRVEAEDRTGSSITEEQSESRHAR